MVITTLLLAAACAAAPAGGRAPLLAQQNELMFQQIEAVHGYSPAQMGALRAIFERSGFAGQGNPAVAVHPLSVEACLKTAGATAVTFDDARFDRICGGRYMAPLYDPEKESPEDARTCIDRFEFPDIPCAYPVVWIRAREAAEVCQALGKRMCDAHEWEGACAGRLLEPDYRFDLAQGVAAGVAVGRMQKAHNAAHAASKAWSYGPAYRSDLCATSGHKSPGCGGEGFQKCGSNTFPAGSFPDCRSPLGVFDLNGNAAEHMNLPLDPSQMSSRGSRSLGVTEMKGSWFVFNDFRAHEDWCRWRAPFWHGGRVMEAKSHANYHLGFRCCKDVAKP